MKNNNNSNNGNNSKNINKKINIQNNLQTQSLTLIGFRKQSKFLDPNKLQELWHL